MRYLLDTCVISELVKKHPCPQVASWIRDQDELSLFVSVVTFGEIEKGIAKGKRPANPPVAAAAAMLH